MNSDDVTVSGEETRDVRVFVELFKNVIIVALLISAVFLINETGVGGSFARPENADAVSPTAETLGAASPAARPAFAVVSDSDGGRYGVKYDYAAVGEIYDRFGPALREAFGLFGTSELVGEDDWNAALSSESVFFDFMWAIPLHTIAGRSEYDGPDCSVRMLFLAQGDDSVSLYYADAESGALYRADTPATASISSRIAEFATNGALFAFEAGQAYSQLDPYVLICRNTPPADKISAHNPLTNEHPWLFKAFGVNDFLSSHFTEADGTDVYVESDGTTLRIDRNGFATYNAAPTEATTDADVIEAVALARNLISRSIGMTCGIARVELISIFVEAVDSDGVDSYTVTFRYMIDNVPVVFPDGRDAAVVQISSGVVTGARLYFREYRLVGEYEYVPQERQIAAAVVGEPLLAYVDSGDNVKAEWIVRNG